MNHVLVPKHEKVTEEEKLALSEKFSIDFTDLPKINAKDAALAVLEVKEGDIIKITRPSMTSGTSIFYRGVVND